MQTDVLDELLYADDMDKNANSRQKCKEPWPKSHSHVITKPPVHGKPYNEPTITLNGLKLKVVDKFIYLGSTLTRAVHIDDEVTARIAKASVAFGRLRAKVWE